MSKKRVKKPEPEPKHQRTYLVRLRIPASNISRVKNIIRQNFSREETLSVSRIGDEKSRADRLTAIRQEIEDAAQEIEDLKEEMEQWHENIPENLQDGEKANAVQECIDNLDTLKDELDTAVSTAETIDFPGIY